MALKGNLRDMTLSDVIQSVCRNRNQARLSVQLHDQHAELFFADGQVVHARLGAQIGEEAVYELLTWDDGEFELETDVEPPERTITVNWPSLLLEGMRRIDESAAQEETTEKPNEEEGEMAPKRSELMADVLSDLIESSGDIEGGALVGIDGLVLSANVPVRGLDETLVGAAAAAVFGLSRRSVEQLGRGEFAQTLIQGSDGNIIVTRVDDRNVFVGLTPASVNLGMAFHEARQAAEKLHDVLS